MNYFCHIRKFFANIQYNYYIRYFNYEKITITIYSFE
nr:MAG TPA: hypothetical protein [Caudoviricetes sp.]